MPGIIKMHRGGDDLMAEILYQRDRIKTLSEWLDIYRLGFYIASAGWLVTVIGFVVLIYR